MPRYLRRKLGSQPGAFRLPGGPVIPIVAVALCLVFAASATRDNLIAGAVALGVGAIIYGLQGKPGNPIITPITSPIISPTITPADTASS